MNEAQPKPNTTRPRPQPPNFVIDYARLYGIAHAQLSAAVAYADQLSLYAAELEKQVAELTVKLEPAAKPDTPAVKPDTPTDAPEVLGAEMEALDAG